MAHSLVPSSITGHVNLARDIAPKFWKGSSDLTVRNYLTFYILNRYGRMTYNARSHSQVWNAKIRQPQVLPLVDNIPMEFVNQDTDIQFYTGIKGMGVTDTMPELEMLLAQGAPEQIVDRYSEKSIDMVTSLDQSLQRGFYLDGNDSANAYNYVGIKTPLSYLATGGSDFSIADKVARPNGTYAGQSCALAANGGTWSAALATKPNASLAKDWPFGQGSSEYDGTAPMVWNYSSSQFGTGSTLWEDNAVRCTTEAATAMTHRGGFANPGGAPLVCVMASEMFIALKHSFRQLNRQMVPFTDGDFGFPMDTLHVDGILYMSDYNVPAGEAYMWSPQYLEMFNVHPQIYKEYGPEFSMQHRGFLYMATAYGNFKWQPKYLARFVSRTTAAA
jgi:hypothetical protein